jgi:TM2 domain-containing membrane protein YozV
MMGTYPAMVRDELSKLPERQQATFNEEYRRKAKSTGVAYLLWLLFGWHYAYLGRWGTQILYWLTAGGFGLWILVDLFRIPSLIGEYNKNVSIGVLKDLQAIRS